MYIGLFLLRGKYSNQCSRVHGRRDVHASQNSAQTQSAMSKPPSYEIGTRRIRKQNLPGVAEVHRDHAQLHKVDIYLELVYRTSNQSGLLVLVLMYDLPFWHAVLRSRHPRHRDCFVPHPRLKVVCSPISSASRNSEFAFAYWIGQNQRLVDSRYPRAP
jgi:hypothetical protein